MGNLNIVFQNCFFTKLGHFKLQYFISAFLDFALPNCFRSQSHYDRERYVI